MDTYLDSRATKLQRFSPKHTTRAEVVQSASTYCKHASSIQPSFSITSTLHNSSVPPTAKSAG